MCWSLNSTQTHVYYEVKHVKCAQDQPSILLAGKAKNTNLHLQTLKHTMPLKLPFGVDKGEIGIQLTYFAMFAGRHLPM